MKTGKTRRILTIMLIMALIITVLPMAANASLADYDPIAVSAINRIITNNGLSGYSTNDPDNWDFAHWDDIVPKQPIALDLQDMDLSGSLVLTGITSLMQLECQDNMLTGLDVTGCTALEYLDCADNQLTSLDVTGITALKWLYCSDNHLTSLDVTRLSALESLECSDNRLNNLDVSNNTYLERLACYENQLTSLDVTGVTALRSLECSDNRLNNLDVTSLIALETFYCSNNRLNNLDVGNNTALKWLGCYNNQLTRLDVTDLTALESLSCEFNELTCLDVTGLTALERLSCDYNKLTSLDVTGLTALEVLFCGTNQLTSLDVTSLTALNGLYCGSNQLTSLDVSKNTALQDLFCGENQLTRLDVTGLNALSSLDCSYNYMKSENDVAGYNSSITEYFAFYPQKDATTYYIKATAGAGGSISPSGNINVIEGGNQKFTITPNDGYLISSVLVDGVSVGVVSTYTFCNVTKTHTIKVEFETKIKTIEKFKDLKAGAWYLDAVDFIVNYGLYEGVSDTEFEPDGNMNRAMFVQVLMRLSDKMGIDTSGNFSNTFKDVKSDAWYKKAVDWAAAKDLVTGYDANAFGPEDSITREQMATMLIRFVDYAKITLKTTEDTQFIDAGKISTWAKDAVERAAAGALVSGVGDGRFDPLGTATRAQVAKLFGNLVENYLL